MITDHIIKSIHTGFIDHREHSLEHYRPKLIINNHSIGQKVSTSIIEELKTCDEFLFSVAFITYGGLMSLMTTLDELEKKGIKGKIIASQYLNFTEPKALKKLLSFKNIELRMIVNKAHHAKGYIFKKQDHYNMIVGSSNLTQSAISVNQEWNVKLSSTTEGSFIVQTLSEFSRIFEWGIPVTKEWIESYEQIYRRVKQGQKNAQKEIIKLRCDENGKINPNKMQLRALNGIEKIRNKGEDRALLISATGTGKTYLACFDIARVKPKSVLFLAHREQILDQAIASFKRVLGSDTDCGKLCSGHFELDKKIVFSTMQTLSKTEILESISKKYFDYIIVDESHRVGSKSYQKILAHFEPEFLLGMTATPERTDDYNICEDFNYNIAYEIRLSHAMAEDMLCPFHYFGITDMNIDGKLIDDAAEFLHLVGDERVNHIINKAEFYGHQGEYTKGLVFCSKNEESQLLSEKFNKIGYKTIALSGKNSQSERLKAIDRLESEDETYRLDYIFTVDIFNEGVDIPSVNQIIMLRPTQSAIIFVQQLGRGLRKHEDKDYVVVLDFIGNYQNNFMIPVALSGDRSFNKDNMRKFVAAGSRIIPGCASINFDSIAQKKIYEAIDSANFKTMKFIKEHYQNLKYRLGRVPTLMDFEEHEAIDISLILGHSSLKSYHKFLSKNDKDYDVKLSEVAEKYIEFISYKLAIGKRPHELIVIEGILKGEQNLKNYMKEYLDLAEIKVRDKTYTNVVNVLAQEFATGSSKKTYEKCKIIDLDFSAQSLFLEELKDDTFRDMVRELVELGLHRNKKYYGKNYKGTSLNLYQKYSYEDVCRLLEWEKNVVSLNIGGYKYDDKTKTYPVFINYHKSDDISDSIKYEDRFVSQSKLIAISKAKRTVNSNDIKTAYSAVEKGIDMELFVRKNKEDNIGKEFYYLGRIQTTGEPKPFKMAKTNQDAVEINYVLDDSVRDDLFGYLTGE
jgi:superfamily II DNA or RNA helicase/HKD family nuclease